MLTIRDWILTKILRILKDFMSFLLSFCLSVYLCKTGAKTALLTLMRNGCLCRFEVANTPSTERKHGT